MSTDRSFTRRSISSDLFRPDLPFYPRKRSTLTPRRHPPYTLSVALIAFRTMIFKFCIANGNGGLICRYHVQYSPNIWQTAYAKAKDINSSNRIFPISYAAAWSMVKKAGMPVNIELRPHDLRRHAATYASSSGTPFEIVSKVILRHKYLSTTQRYLGKVNDTEAIRWIGTFYG